MSQFFQAIFKPIWELLIVVPMPWRFTIVTLVLIPVLFWLIFRGFPWLVAKLSYVFFIFTEILANVLLFGEYITTQHTRSKKQQSLPKIIYIFDDFLGAIVKIFYKINRELTRIYDSYFKKRRWLPSKRLFILLATIVPLIWYTRPLLGANNVSKFLHSGETWWYSLEGWILNGVWKASAASFAPEDFIRNYFSTLNNHQYQQAWNLITVKFKNDRRLTYISYLSFWKYKIEQTNVIDLKNLSKANNSARIDVHLQYIFKKNKRPSDTEIIRFFLVWNDRAKTWSIDSTQKL